MTGTIDLLGDPNIGVYARVFEDIAIVDPRVSGEFIEALGRELSVDVVTTTIQGSGIIGSLVAGNSQGLVVSGLAAAEEVAVLEEHREVLLLEGSMNAAGNVILANDYVAAVHPDMEVGVAEEIGSFLGVPVIRLTLGGIKTVGMAGCATNKGILAHPRANDTEIAALERVVDLPIGLGSVNMGSGLVGTGLLANSKGYIAGSFTTGFELGRIEEVFGFWSEAVMENQTFEVVGACRINNAWKPYRKVIEAPNENQARERVFADIGSKHRLKRRYITIESVNVVAGE